MVETRNSETFLAKLKWKVSEREIVRIERAYRESKYGHRGQPRDGGERYFEHPKGVALILIDELQIYDSDMIIAALLHDIIEDSYILKPKEIEEIFGEKVRYLVDTLSKKPNSTQEDKQAYLEGIAQASTEVQIIKLADRLHNMRSIGSCTLDKQRRNLEETRNFFLPLAWRINPYLAQALEEACEHVELELP